MTTGVRADLTTIVVNWNTVGLLDDCLNSIRSATPEGVVNEIVVVDNASADGSVEHLKRFWPDVTLIEQSENTGFCRANNAAIRATSAPLLLLVNTDARMHPGGIAAILRYFADDPRTAVVGPRLVYGDGSFQRWTAGRLPSLASMATFFLGLDKLPPLRHHGLYIGADDPTPRRTEWVSSAVMGVRRAALDDIGLLDDRIFVYMDDVDLCARAAEGGWHTWYAADTTATHFMGASSVRNTGKVSPEALRALNRWYVRRHGRRSGIALRAIEVVGFGARVALHTLRGLRSGKPDPARNGHASYLRLALEPIDA